MKILAKIFKDVAGDQRAGPNISWCVHFGFYFCLELLTRQWKLSPSLCINLIWVEPFLRHLAYENTLMLEKYEESKNEKSYF